MPAPIIPYERQVAAPQTVRGVVPTMSGASGVAQGLADLGRGISAAGADFARQEQIRKQAEEKQADERARVWAGEAAGQNLLAEMQTMQEAQRKAPPGADGFASSYLEGFDQRAAAVRDAAPDEISRRFITMTLQQQRAHLGQQAQSFQFQQGDADAVNRFTNSVDSWGKVVQQDPGQFRSALQTLATTMPDLRADVKEKASDAARTTLTNAAASHWLDADPYKVQEFTSKALGDKGFTGPTGADWIDAATPAQIKTWNDQATTKIRMIEAQQGREAEAREKLAERTFGQALELSQKGQYFDAPFQTALLTATRGTAFEQEAAGLIADQKNTAGFASGSAAQRDAALSAMRSRGADPAQGTNPGMSKELAKLEGIDTAIKTAVARDPWEAAQQYGVLKEAALTPITSGQDALKVIGERIAAAGPVESWAGAKLSPLRPQEAAQFADLVAKLPPSQAASLLGQVGQQIGDAERTAALARQIKDKDDVLATAMSFAGTQTSEGRYAAELVLLGNQAIKDKTIKADGAIETGWRASIAKQVRGAYVNRQVEDQVVNAAFLIAAAKGGDVDNAVRLATGGGVIDFNGSKVPMPVGYAADGGQSGAEDKFRKAIASVDPAQLFSQATDGKVYAQGVPMNASEFLQNLPKSQLVMAGRARGGGNAYWVRSGTSLVTNVDGVPIRFILK